MYGEQVQKLSEADRSRISENLGLNDPLPIQYGKWVLQVAQGEWGHSFISGEAVTAMVVRATGPTFSLMLSSHLIKNPASHDSFMRHLLDDSSEFRVSNKWRKNGSYKNCLWFRGGNEAYAAF